MAEIISGTNFDSTVLKASVPVVVDFYAPWCGPCRQMSPIFDQVSQEMGGTCQMIKVNIDEDRELAIKYGVSSIPTLLFFKNGNVVSKETGFMSKDLLSEKVKELCK